MNAYKSNIWKFYLASILGGFTYFYNSIETLYFRHFNLSFEQIGFLISSSLIAAILFEIPSGAFADLYGRKKSIIIASSIGLIGLFFLAIGSSFEVFIVGFVLMGIARAFNSGANNALLYDSLDALDNTKDYLKHQSRMQSGFIAVDIISGTLGFLLFAANVRLPYYISFLAMILVIGVQFSMYEKLIKKVYTDNVFVRHISQIKIGLREVFRSKLLLWFLCFGLLHFVTQRFFSDVISTPFLREIKGFSFVQLAILFLITNSIQTAFVFNSNLVEKKLGRFWSFLAITIAIPATFLLTYLSNNFLLTGLVIGIYYAFLSFGEVISENYINKIVKSSHRATVLSVNSMFISFFGLTFLPLLGRTVDYTNLNTGMIIITLATFIFGSALLLIKYIYFKKESYS